MIRKDHHAKPPPLETELAALKLVKPKLRDPKHPVAAPPKHGPPK